MTTQTLTLTDFLLARIAQDEADCQKALAEVPDHGWASFVLAECEARRRIVELHAAYAEPQRMVYGTITACSECGNVDDSPVEWPCPTLRILALPYADHPDYREEWRP